MGVLTEDNKKKLLELGRGAVDNQASIEEIIQRLIANSDEAIREIIGEKELPECGVSYKSIANPEMLMWSLGLICQEWVLYLLKRKQLEGHCHNHKEQTGKPCQKGKEFHEDLFNEAEHHFQSILNQDYEKQIKEELGNKL